MENYQNFIKEIRTLLGREITPKIEGVQVLANPAPNTGPFELFQLTVSSDGYGPPIQLMFRQDNLYLYGYRRGITGSWYELRHGTPTTHVDAIRTFDETTERLDINDDYGGLKKKAGDRSLETVSFSYNDISLKFGDLERTTDPNKTQLPVALAIMTLVVAISEASRFKTISTIIETAWLGGVTLEADSIELITSWDHLSEAVLTFNKNSATATFTPVAGIRTFEAAVAALALLKAQ